MQSHQLMLLIRPMLLCTCALLALGASVSAACTLRGQALAALASLCGSWFLAVAAILVAANAAQDLFSAKNEAQVLRLEADPAEPIFAVQSYQQSLVFYLQRPLVLVDYRDEFDFGLNLRPQQGIATLGQFATVWSSLRGGFAVVPLDTLERLGTLGVPMREIARFHDRAIVSRR